MQVAPGDSTTYKLYAKGPGGTQTALTRVTVTVPTPPPAPPAGPSEDELFSQNVRDIYFDFDSAEIRPDQQTAIERDAAFLAQHPNIGLTGKAIATARSVGATLWHWRCGQWNERNCCSGRMMTTSKTISLAREAQGCATRRSSSWRNETVMTI